MIDTAWWKRGIIYQIYPRSFQDSDGDGVGDLNGMRRRLDYLTWLGIDAIWISPIYPSPMADFGYDITDYCNIDPVFGTLADFDALLHEAHQRSVKVILDFVPNHTSDRHPWFMESRSSQGNAKRDWYIWRDGDPWEKNEPGLGVGRDPWRTPLQWDESEGAGFTAATPWLPLDQDFRHNNVAVLKREPR